MAEKPILITPEGKKIMTLSGAKAYYESKRKPKKKALGPLKNYKGNLLVTLGEKGVRFNNTIIPPQRQAEVSDLSGAGDTFFAAFVFSYLTNKNVIESIAFAQKCALEVVEKKGVVII